MAAFPNQQQPFVVDTSFMLNNKASDIQIGMLQEQHHFSHFIFDPYSDISEPHHSTGRDHKTGSMLTYSDREPLITNKQSDATSAVLEELQNGDGHYLSKNVIFMKKNKKRRRASPSSSTKSKDASATQRKSNKKPKKSNGSINGDEKKVPQEPPKGYIHVRAKRGQATDSHSLAERVRREKISEKMKMLQTLVPGCDKVSGKALMLDQVISYVRSLQNQVEFLKMKLASLNPTLVDLTFDVNTFIVGHENNQLDSFASQVPPVQLCSSNQPAAFVDAPTATAAASTSSCLAEAFTFHPLINNDHCNLLSNDPHSVLLQGQSTPVFAQDCASLYLDMEDPWQKFLSLCDFAATCVPCINGMGHIE